MESFQKVLQTLDLDSIFDNEYFNSLVSDQVGRRVTAWEDLVPTPARRMALLDEPYTGMYRMIFDEALPDQPQHLHVTVYPHALGDPMAETIAWRIGPKPYTDVIRFTGEPYRIDLGMLYKVLDEAQGEDTPITILTTTKDVKKILFKMIDDEKFYLLPPGSRWFHTSTPLDSAEGLGYSLISLMGQATGIGPDKTYSIFGGRTFPSWCWSVDSKQGFKMPPWVKATTKNGEIVVCDLSLPEFPVVRTHHKGSVDGRFVHLASVQE